MTKYLAAVDLNDKESCKKIVEMTARIADGSESQIYLMTVIEGITPGIDQRYAIRGEMHGSTDYPMHEWKEKAAQELQEIAKQSIAEKSLAGVVVENGSVYREIVKVAKDLDIDQVVMGAHHPTKADFLLGSNSARVARHAECTVTVVR